MAFAGFEMDQNITNLRKIQHQQGTIVVADLILSLSNNNAFERNETSALVSLSSDGFSKVRLNPSKMRIKIKIRQTLAEGTIFDVTIKGSSSFISYERTSTIYVSDKGAELL